MVLLNLDLAMESIAAQVKLRPILYWVQVWTNKGIAAYREGLPEVVGRPKSKIPWLFHV